VPRKPTSSAAAAIPETVRPAHDAIVALTDRFCRDRLNDEYAALCRRLVGELARQRPSPITRGKPEGWAAGVVRAAGRVNFLDDPAQTPHLKMAEIDRAFGVSLATAQAKARAIGDLLELSPFHPDWTLPGLMEQNPLAWLLTVNGLIVDARDAPREVQEEAFRKGLIPYVPGGGPVAPASAPGRARGRKTAPAQDVVYPIKITLLDTHPPVWRRIRVKDCTLDELHAHVQTAMGWTNSHLHHFIIGDRYYGDPELMVGDLEYEDSTQTKLSDVVPERSRKFRFLYEYDFGDSWRHEILVERREPPEEGAKYPTCVDGARACPPEDCGGPWGYEDFVAAMADPRHERHAELQEWLGEPFDPEAFDPAAATRRMHGLRLGR
jgi:hypothetical protein